MEGALVLTDRHVFALKLVYMWVQVAFRKPMRTLSISAKAAGWMRGAAPPVRGRGVSTTEAEHGVTISLHFGR